MNSNSIYSYFLLSKTWDLSYDVIELVKKWLEPHLKRIMMNVDYNLFMYIAESNFIKNLISLNKKEKIMLSRYGFNNNVNHNLKIRINTTNIKQMYGSVMPHSLYELYDIYSKQYFIFGIPITMRDIVINLYDLPSQYELAERGALPDAGVTGYTRNIFIINFRFENPKLWIWSWPLTLCEQKTIMRNIMNKEEEIISNIS